MAGTVTKKWANTNIVWESNPELVGMLYKLIVQTKKEQVVVRILKDDFNKVEIGDTVEIVEKKELSPFTRCNFPYYEFVRKVEKVEGKPNMKKKMSKKNYMIPVNCIDCPISVKQRLFEEVEHHCFTIKRVGNRMFVFDSNKVEPRDFLYTTKEEIYFKEQLEENKWYNIVDILTDREVA